VCLRIIKTNLYEILIRPAITPRCDLQLTAEQFAHLMGDDLLALCCSCSRSTLQRKCAGANRREVSEGAEGQQHTSPLRQIGTRLVSEVRWGHGLKLSTRCVDPSVHVSLLFLRPMEDLECLPCRLNMRGGSDKRNTRAGQFIGSPYRCFGGWGDRYNRRKARHL
jgi:hypothetical protein